MTEEAEEEGVDLYLTVHGAAVRGVVNLVRVGVFHGFHSFQDSLFNSIQLLFAEIDIGKHAPSLQL